MSYDIEKLIDILTIFSKNNQDLTKLRIVKLLYFIDKLHLQKYGRVVLNDRYYKLPKGPIPSLTLNLLNEFFDPEFAYAVKNHKIDKSKISHFLEATGSYRLKIKKESDFESLSKSELEIIDEVLKIYGLLDTDKIVDMSHKDATWLKTEEPKEIDYCLFLDGMSEDKKRIIEGLMSIDKENEIYLKQLENDCSF
ncbi:MAG: Panacea domain-containing protein [Actinobacteria bacterium]|nr:Panacea domain-containing protein [Actinomycetota bacterium]